MHARTHTYMYIQNKMIYLAVYINNTYAFCARCCASLVSVWWLCNFAWRIDIHILNKNIIEACTIFISKIKSPSRSFFFSYVYDQQWHLIFHYSFLMQMVGLWHLSLCSFQIHTCKRAFSSSSFSTASLFFVWRAERTCWYLPASSSNLINFSSNSLTSFLCCCVLSNT